MTVDNTPVMFNCHICGNTAHIEVTWPDGYSLRLCDNDAPVPIEGLSFIDLYHQMREAHDH